jgi:hypothetical protein
MNLTVRDGFIMGLITSGLIAFGVISADSYIQEYRLTTESDKQELRNYVDMRIKSLEEDINRIVVEMPDDGSN